VDAQRVVVLADLPPRLYQRRALYPAEALVSALQQKVTKADGFADASDAQSAKLNTQEAGYEAQRNAAGAKVDTSARSTRR